MCILKCTFSIYRQANNSDYPYHALIPSEYLVIFNELINLNMALISLTEIATVGAKKCWTPESDVTVLGEPKHWPATRGPHAVLSLHYWPQHEKSLGLIYPNWCWALEACIVIDAWL